MVLDGQYQPLTHLFLLPSPPPLPPQVGALSLNGKIFTCLVLDDEVTPGAHELGEHFIDELMDLARRTGLENVKKEDIFG